MRQFYALSKVEEQSDGTLHVEGVASSQAVDSDGEIIRADAMSKALPDFFRHGTGALREMHQPIAAGRVDKAEVGTDGLTTITATVVDPAAIRKVKAGVYKGFSIGGRVTARDSLNKNVITGLRLTEISLVDRPANPESVLTLVKVDDGDFLGKVGARNSAADLARLQAIHDHAVGMGASCPGSCDADDADAPGDDADKAARTTLAKVVAQRDAALSSLDALLGKADALERRLRDLESQAAPPKYLLQTRSVSKSEDTRDQPDDTPATTVQDAIRKAHRNPLLIKL